MRDEATALAGGAAVGYRAAENGHVIGVQYPRGRKKRFIIKCSCGWQTPPRADRKAAFAGALDHAASASRGDIPKAG